jgi:hypothetical protein
MKPNLDKLEDLSDEQLKEISTNVDQIGFRKAAAQATQDLNRDIDKSTVQRFVDRATAKDFLDETPDSATAATEVLRFAATGTPDFSAATVQVLDQTAFKLSLVCTRTAEQMKALNQVTTMLCRYRSQTVRERMAAVQEHKAKLREQELKFRRSQKSGAQFQTPNSVPCDELGPFATDSESLRARARVKFKIKKRTPRTRPRFAK